MLKQDEASTILASRRGFLRRTLTAGAGLAAAAVIPQGAAAAAEGDGMTQASPKARGYHLTPHILDYYKSAAQ